MMIRCLALLAIATDLFSPLLKGVITDNHDLLWRVVQTCVADHRVTGNAFPCIEVNETEGLGDGFVVLRSPQNKTDIVISPTARIAGVEDSALQSPGAPNFFQDAWAARRYVIESAPRPIGRDDIGLAINSQISRTQDQLHIHVDCVRSSVLRALRAADGKLRFGTWSPFKPDADSPEYLALKLKGDDLNDVNVFRLAAEGLAIKPQDLAGMTIAVIGASFPDGANGFYLLTGSANFSGADNSEDLLDHKCRADNN